MVLHNYRIDRVAQLFGVNDKNGRIDPKTNESEVEGGLFTEELATRYSLIVIKWNSLRWTIAGEGLPVGPAPPQGPSLGLALMESLEACIGIIHGGVGGRGPRSPSYITRRGGDGIPVPALHKFMQGYKNLLKHNVPAKTITNSFLVMNRQIWTN